MALTEQEKQRILELLDQENQQNKSQILSSVKSFQKWLQVVFGIFQTIAELYGIYKSFCG